MSRLPPTADFAVRTCALILSLLCAATGRGEVQEIPRRVVIRNATLYRLDAAEVARREPSMTIFIDGATITAIQPTTDNDLGDREVLVDARGGFVMPGFIEFAQAALDSARPSYGQLVPLTASGVTTVLGSWTEVERAWLRRIAETSSFRVPEFVSTESKVPAQSVAEAVIALGTENGRSREQNAKALRELTIERAHENGLATVGGIAVGMRADLLVVAEDPLDDPRRALAPTQMLLGGATLRISTLETARTMTDRAQRFLKDLPPGAPGDTSFAIETGGFRVGRLDVSASRHRGQEWWGPPIDIASAWTFEPAARTPGQSGVAPQSWTSVQTFRSADGTPLRSVTIVADERSMTATVRSEGEPGAAPVSELIPATAAFALFDPVSALSMAGTGVAGLEIGQSVAFDVAEVEASPTRTHLGIRRIEVERVESGHSAMPIPDWARAFVLKVPLADALEPRPPEVLGWVAMEVLADGGTLRAVRAALLAPDGVTEYLPLATPHPTPPTPGIRPAGSPSTSAIDVPTGTLFPNSPRQDPKIPQPS